LLKFTLLNNFTSLDYAMGVFKRINNMQRKMKTAVVMILMLATVVTLSGCWPFPSQEKIGEKIIEKTIETQTGGKVNVDTSNGEVNIQSGDGSAKYSAGGNVTLPDGFPKELILASDAKPFIATSGEESMTVGYFTNEDKTALWEKYKTNLVAGGWKKEMEINAGTGLMVNFKKGTDNLSVTVGNNSDKEQTQKTTVHLVYVIEKSTQSGAQASVESEAPAENIQPE
jgi:hypothetical protein